MSEFELNKQTEQTEQSNQSEKLCPIVINECFGGFGLSNKAITKYLRLKGITFIAIKKEHSIADYYINKNNIFDELFCCNCNCDFNSCICENTTILDDFVHLKCTCDSKNIDYCRCISSCYFSYDEIKRTDPILAQVVLELGSEAHDMCAKLSVKYFPKGTKYRINEYDGFESIETENDIRWSVM
jgi:hypothetical protein